MQGDIFIDDAVHFPFDEAESAFHRYPAGTEALFGNRNTEFFGIAALQLYHRDGTLPGKSAAKGDSDIPGR